MSARPPIPNPTPNAHDDVRLIVSGNFSQDALGPERHRDILARLHAAPQQYLDAFRALVSEAERAGRFSALHLPWFLTLLARTDPAMARGAASELLTKYEAALGAARSQQPEGLSTEQPQRARPTGLLTEHEKLQDRLRSRSDELKRILNL